MCEYPRELNLYCLFACFFPPRTRCTKWQWKIEKVVVFFSLFIFFIILDTCTQKQASYPCARLQTTFNSIAVDFLNLLAVQVCVFGLVLCFCYFFFFAFCSFPLNGNLFTGWYYFFVDYFFIEIDGSFVCRKESEKLFQYWACACVNGAIEKKGCEIFQWMALVLFAYLALNDTQGSNCNTLYMCVLVGGWMWVYFFFLLRYLVYHSLARFIRCGAVFVVAVDVVSIPTKLKEQWTIV